MNDSFASRKGTRSCGRRGPASDGSTSPRSSSTTCEYSGWCCSSCQSEFSLQYVSTSASRSSLRPVRRRYLSVSSSTGKKPHVAPYSGDMFPIVARSASARPARPWPKYSTNLPTTPVWRRSCVTVRTRSVAVALELELRIPKDGPGAAELVDLDRVVDDELSGEERVNTPRTPAEIRH